MERSQLQQAQLLLCNHLCHYICHATALSSQESRKLEGEEFTELLRKEWKRLDEKHKEGWQTKAQNIDDTEKMEQVEEELVQLSAEIKTVKEQELKAAVKEEVCGRSRIPKPALPPSPPSSPSTSSLPSHPSNPSPFPLPARTRPSPSPPSPLAHSSHFLFNSTIHLQQPRLTCMLCPAAESESREDENGKGQEG